MTKPFKKALVTVLFLHVSCGLNATPRAVKKSLASGVNYEELKEYIGFPNAMKTSLRKSRLKDNPSLQALSIKSRILSSY